MAKSAPAHDYRFIECATTSTSLHSFFASIWNRFTMLNLHWTVSAALTIGQLLDAQSGPPPASKQPVTDVYHGIKVVDEYRWLENSSNPETQVWSEAQNEQARKYLNELPGRVALREQIKLLLSKPSANFFGLCLRGSILFAIRIQPPKEQPFLVVLQSPNHPESARVLLDPAQLDPAGRTSIDFYVPSRDGKYVAVSLSKGGSESGDVHERTWLLRCRLHARRFEQFPNRAHDGVKIVELDRLPNVCIDTHHLGSMMIALLVR